MSDVKTCGMCKNCKPCASDTEGLCDLSEKLPHWMWEQLTYVETRFNVFKRVRLDDTRAAECDCFEEVTTK